MSNLRKLLYIISWIPVMVIHIILILLGLIIVPIAIRIYEAHSVVWPKLFWVWGNDEEEYPSWAADRDISPFWWYAIRNPVNNFRFIFSDRKAAISGNWTEDRMEAQDLIDRNMRRAYRWSYNGLFAGYRKVWITARPSHMPLGVPGEYSELWVGWKIGSAVPGMGFTLQYRRNREIGK